MNNMKIIIATTALAACMALSATALASPAFGRGARPSMETTMTQQMLQVSPQHPDRMVGGQGMPALGGTVTRVTANSPLLHNLHTGYRGFVADGR